MQTYQDIENIYSEMAGRAEEELRLVQRTIRYISLVRVLLFVGIIAVAILMWGEERVLYAACIVLPLALFIGLVKWHNRWFLRRDYLKKLMEINRQELNALRGDISAFDAGEEFADPSHLYTFDLDIFGNRSLFQCLNRTSTHIGKQWLAHWLNNPLKEKSLIEKRQEAVRELAPQLEFRQRFRLKGLLNESSGNDRERIKNWLDTPVRFLKNRLFRGIPYLVLLINIASFTAVLCGAMPTSIAATLFAVLVSLSFLLSGTITKLQLAYGKNLRILSAYADQIVEIEKLEVKAEGLADIRGRLSGEKGKTASQILTDLVKRMDSLDRRGNIFMLVLLNGLFFWELWLTLRVERWKVQYAACLPGWLEAVGEMDACCSLATFAYNHPDYVCPEVSSDGFRLEAEGLGHPLMEREKCVRNDVAIPGKPFFLIVTGANMAGKSTYLRTVGVNYLLACLGAPVWARRMRFTPVQLVTSLRTTDSLADNESYFFAELKRLQRIIQKLEAGEQLFIILDEILKGTNSVDKQNGSLALVRQFMRLNTNGIIATHDLMLGTLSESFPDRIRNYCFEADITDNELTFSYRMREGVAQNMNACFLMKKMGIAVDFSPEERKSADR